MAETAAETRDMDIVAVSPKLPPLSSILKALFAGGIAGGLSRTAVAPLERLKILQQVQDQNNPRFKGIMNGLSYMYKTEGLKGLFKGNWTNCVRIVPNSAIKFFTYEQVSHYLLYRLRQANNDPTLELNPVLRLGAGAVAGIIAMSATYPLEMVRGRLSVQAEALKSMKTPVEPQYKGIVHAAQSIVKEEGIVALFKGWTPSIIGVIPYVGFNFAVYETLKDYLIKRNRFTDETQLSVFSRLMCGAVAGSFGQTVAYPFDVVRRRLQVAGWKGASAITASSDVPLYQYRGMTHCFIQMVKDEGFSSLFRGLAPNYLKVVPSIAIAFVVYEKTKELIGVEIKISSS